MSQEQGQHHVYYDRDLEAEVCRPSGVVQKFPNHSHDLCATGFIKGRRRHLWCKDQECDVNIGNLLLFNPRDDHCCGPLDGKPLDYHAVNINPQVIERFVKEITGKDFEPYFIQNVVYRSEIVQSVVILCDPILRHAARFEKEETMFFLLEQVLQEYASSFGEEVASRPNPQVQSLCIYMEKHFPENTSLNELTKMTTFSKSYLLRSLIKQVGVSPCRYLQAIRLDKAKHFLEQGIPPVDAVAVAGFSDQGHFTNFFKKFVGLTPRQYQKIFSDLSGLAKLKGEPRHEL